MLRIWISLSLLSAEAHQVVWLRTWRLMAGGSSATSEAVIMTTEKVVAAQDAFWRLLRGATTDNVIGRYRTRVRANRKRLSR
jgi:hypothetical protein